MLECRRHCHQTNCHKFHKAVKGLTWHYLDSTLLLVSSETSSIMTSEVWGGLECKTAINSLKVKPDTTVLSLEGRQGCGFRIPSAFQQSSVPEQLFNALLFIFYKKQFQRKSPSLPHLLRILLHLKNPSIFKHATKAAQIRKTASKASEPQQRSTPNCLKNEFCETHKCAIRSMRKHGFEKASGLRLNNRYKRSVL